MQLSNAQRVRKLVGNISRHPANLPRYVAHNLVTRRSPIELQLPWFSYSAIDFLKIFLRKTHRVFEFGSGGSTLFFADRCASVESVEEDPSWATLVVDRATQLGLTNVTVYQRPFDFHAATGFEQSDYLAQICQSTYDVIVVDGADNDFTIRPHCFRLAEEHVTRGGIIIVDDSWRYTDLRSQHRAKRMEVFESVGPARFGVTSTDIYFY